MHKAHGFIARRCCCPLSILLATVALCVAAFPVNLASAEDRDALVQFLTPLSSEAGNITFNPGLRGQVRYTYDDADGNHDIRINRLRLKGGGDVFGLAKYYAEIKIDSQSTSGGGNGSAAVENGWLYFTVIPALAVRVGS